MRSENETLASGFYLRIIGATSSLIVHGQHMPQLLISGSQLQRRTRPRDLSPYNPQATSLDTGEMVRRNVEPTLPNPMAMESPARPTLQRAIATPSPSPREDDELEQALRRTLVEQTISQATAPRRTPDLPTYQPLQKHGFKDRLIGLIGGLGQGYLRSGGSVAGMIGGGLAGTVNPDAPRYMEWQQNELGPAMQREQQLQQQDVSERKDAVERLGMLTHAATALKALRNPNDIYKPVTGAEYATIINPATGKYEVLRDADGNPIESANVVTGRERGQAQRDVAAGHDQTRLTVADQRVAAQRGIAEGRNQTQLEIADKRNAGQLERDKLRIAAQRALQGMRSSTALKIEGMRGERAAGLKTAELLSRQPSQAVVTDAEIKAARAADPNLAALSETDLRTVLKEAKQANADKGKLPNAQQGVDFLSNWKNLKK